MMRFVQRVAILGGKSQLAADIYRHFTDKGWEVTLISREEADVTNSNQLQSVLGQIQPQFVINTAAYHQVDEVETNPVKAFAVNAIAQKLIADVCRDQGLTMVSVSTDYVYGLDKTRHQPYTESDPTAPLNVYGLSKAAGEQMVRRYAPNHFIIRVSGLFGLAGSAGKGGNFVETMIRLGKEKGQVKVVNDQVLSPTYTKNIAENLFELLQTQNYGTYHLTSTGHCSWWEFAQEIFTQLHLDVSCEAVGSEFYRTVAQRPIFSVLAKDGLEKLGINHMNDWQTNLHLYLQEKGYLS